MFRRSSRLPGRVQTRVQTGIPAGRQVGERSRYPHPPDACCSLTPSPNLHNSHCPQPCQTAGGIETDEKRRRKPISPAIERRISGEETPFTLTPRTDHLLFPDSSYDPFASFRKRPDPLWRPVHAGVHPRSPPQTPRSGTSPGSSPTYRLAREFGVSPGSVKALDRDGLLTATSLGTAKLLSPGNSSFAALELKRVCVILRTGIEDPTSGSIAVAIYR